MEDWEEEQVPALLKKDQPRSNWDDEDLDEDEIKDSWEDEDEPEPAPSPAPVKASKKPVSSTKKTENEGKTAEVIIEAPLTPEEEKLRLQRLVEEADLKNIDDLFGKKGVEKSLANFIPKSESDFAEYAELISDKLRLYEKSYHYLGLLKAVMRLSMTSLKAADAKEVASSATAVANEKLKLEKEANAGKKKTGLKKKQLQMDKPDDDLVVSRYDDADDYDFM